jgi:Zn-dependent peptidase ImmA (M78 family)
MSSRADRIARLAREILDQADVTEPPVPIERVAKSAGFRLIKEHLDSDFSGFYVMRAGIPTIGINIAHPPVRQRFTIAHEIGHAKLHAIDHYDREFRRDPNSATATDPDEIDANSFAANLLMPAEWIHERWAETTDLFDNEWVVRTARDFGVSTQSLMYRIENLGLLRSPLF